MQFFVEKSSIVRKIWGKSDTVLFIFAGAAAEFALNKSVDWLYFTGKLPADPIGRLFSTVRYARWIIFTSKDEANKAIDTIRLLILNGYLYEMHIYYRTWRKVNTRPIFLNNIKNILGPCGFVC